jgi:ribosomal-protein-alanine N-acetyltransferase
VPTRLWVIAPEDDLVGAVGLTLQEDVYRRSAEIGYWLGEPFWGRGLATEAVLDATRIAFERFDIVRVFARVFETNPASCRVLEKAGYVLEGRMRRAVVKGGWVLDQFLYARVAED